MKLRIGQRYFDISSMFGEGTLLFCLRESREHVYCQINVTFFLAYVLNLESILETLRATIHKYFQGNCQGGSKKIGYVSLFQKLKFFVYSVKTKRSFQLQIAFDFLHGASPCRYVLEDHPKKLLFIFFTFSGTSVYQSFTTEPRF